MLRGDNTEIRAWIIGEGAASLIAAQYMIDKIDMKGINIYIYEESIPASGKLSSYDSDLILLRDYLEHAGVTFKTGVYIIDLDIVLYADTEQQVVKNISYRENGENALQAIGFEDMVILTGKETEKFSAITGMEKEKKEEGFFSKLWDKIIDKEPDYYHNLIFLSTGNSISIQETINPFLGIEK